MTLPLRIAMWSGPRNISTALMRSWENRPDTLVCDEPLYAHYLEQTGLDHPGAEEIRRVGETDWRAVVAQLTAPLPADARIFYQKHMAHHLLPEIDRSWLGEMRHAFLIRDPREMLLSLSKVTPEPTLEDTGLPQQVEIFERVCLDQGSVPPVLDAKDVLEAPEALLQALCRSLGVSFDACMLQWPAGRRESDGIWARHWYDSVERSTGFQPWKPRTGELDGALADVYEQCRAPYEALWKQRLTA